MTQHEIVKEKKNISNMILESIQEKHDLNHLTGLLTRQLLLSSESKEKSEEQSC
jgi:hypothetical protein